LAATSQKPRMFQGTVRFKDNMFIYELWREGGLEPIASVVSEVGEDQDLLIQRLEDFFLIHGVNFPEKQLVIDEFALGIISIIAGRGSDFRTGRYPPLRWSIETC